MVLGGYVTAKDMDGLTKYYKSLFDDCNNLNNLAAINPETINNPSIYAILADKYNKAISKNIQLELGVFIDLNSLHIDTYELNRQLVIVENTYKNKDIDTFKIFEKAYTTKPNNTGLGLWEVNKILKKHDNLAIFTSKDDELFKQQLEIYLPKPSLLKI